MKNYRTSLILLVLLTLSLEPLKAQWNQKKTLLTSFVSNSFSGYTVRGGMLEMGLQAGQRIVSPFAVNRPGSSNLDVLPLPPFKKIKKHRGNANHLFPDDDWLWGFYGGATLSKFNRAKETIIPSHFPDSTYSFKVQYDWGAVGGAQFYRRFSGSAFAVDAKIGIVQSGGKSVYEHSYFDSLLNRVDSLKYTIDFNHQYLAGSCLLKVYPLIWTSRFFSRFYVGAGAQVAFNINDHSLRYTHDRPDLVDELYVQQGLRETLKGRMDLAVVVELGWEYYFDNNWGINAGFRWSRGVNDRLETLPNGNGFRDPANHSNSFQLTVGAVFPFQ